MTANRPDTMTDLESLSALYDGELDGDAARFAMKRLGHDADWQRACGQWQLIGDVLRGRATTAAADDLASRVTAAVAREAVPVVMPEPRRSPAPVVHARPRRWVAGAALAASVAAAALFVARPSFESRPSGAAAIAVAAPSTSSSAPAAVAVGPAAPDAVAVAEPVVPRRTPAAAPANSSRLALAPSRRPVRATGARDPRVEPARAATAALAAQALRPGGPAPALAEAGTDPFRPSGEAITTRPWPRAVLPGPAAAGGLTASFGSPAQVDSPSFYPFEPRLPAEPAPDAPQP